MDVGQQIIDKVTALTTVDQGLATAIDTIVAQDTDIANQLRALLAAGGNTISASDLQTVLAQLDSNTSSLSTKRDQVTAAVTANTVTPTAPTA